jgi:hypothetical protein
MKKPATATRRNRTVRCAIYTRKSSEEGLEQEFNSLQAQREACEAFIVQPLWDAVQAQLASNAAERNSSTRHRQPSLLAGLLFDGDGNRMTPSYAVKKGTRYRYYVSGSLITKDRSICRLINARTRASGRFPREGPKIPTPPAGQAG